MPKAFGLGAKPQCHNFLRGGTLTRLLWARPSHNNNKFINHIQKVVNLRQNCQHPAFDFRMVLGRHVGDSFATTVTTMPIICSCISELLEVAVPQNRILHDVALINSGHHFVLYICLLGMTGIEDH